MAAQAILLNKERADLDAKSHAVHKQLLVDSLDMLIPIGILGIVNLNNGIVGIAGAITSLLGAHDIASRIRP
ncbi:hypothetical protein AYI68_g7029 [Smittium mucronatum]|uniref:Uncharacterized protein n=1 Tax=Smittium mucronatum TaxID=133383 RepID=A0A1R0GPU2_9FUNG|nr:hypothetical protein AYI68_g7029 [Smittium mucronatum]